MSTLILTLPFPTGTNAPEYDYVLSPDGLVLGSHGRAVASMLPAHTRRGLEVVALVPARALSWHRIALPEKVLRSMLAGRMDAARARSVLSGVLEEQLLDEPDALHLAVFAAPPEGESGNAWVAACDRAWLHGQVQALEAAGLPTDRIAAECTPQETGDARLFVSDAMAPAQMVLCSPQGVSLLPLQDAALQRAKAASALHVFAELAVVALAEQHFGNTVALQTRAERHLQAAQSAWNLAQFDLNASARGRVAKRMGTLWQQLLHAAAWRPARWCLLALVLVQLVAINAQAWHQRKQLEEQRSAAQAVLTQTFPDVQLVVDAPLQMQRAVDDLARARGVGVGTDLGRVLALVTPLWPEGSALLGIELQGSVVRLRASALDGGAAQRLNAALETQGLRARLQGDVLVIEPQEAR
jgi:general secretion pathway protein L